jgi:acetylornithine deacetylase/succinyl-diaminopimelate desuccinylase-like protein
MDAAAVTPDFNIKVIVDSEEELGSPNLPAAVERYRDALAADMLVIFDGPRHPTNLPTLTFGARGIATITLTVYGPRVPQHSGHYGNWAPNPAFRLTQILASMKDEFGRVTIPGFYDGVVLDDATRAVLARVPDDETAIKQQLGIVETDSVGATLQEARQYPSINIRGMASGWVGEQRRTIVPSFATAEIDVRLVKESDPERLLGLLRRHIEGLGYYVIDREPTEAERQSRPRIATFTSNISYAAYRTEMDSDIGHWLTDAMVHLFGEEPIKIRTSGGSIPISPFVATLDVPAVTVPTVNPDNNQHSPNENLRLGNFVEGVQVMLAILQQPMR